jgi:hypothetical protein
VLGLDSPPVGNSPGKDPTPTPKAISSMMPSQNSGMAYRASDAPSDTRSNRLLRRHAPRMPIHNPIAVEHMVDRPSSSTVGQIRSPITSETGRRNL